jgi:hypothetical protein
MSRNMSRPLYSGRQSRCAIWPYTAIMSKAPNPSTPLDQLDRSSKVSASTLLTSNFADSHSVLVTNNPLLFLSERYFLYSHSHFALVSASQSNLLQGSGIFSSREHPAGGGVPRLMSRSLSMRCSKTKVL